MIISLGFRCMIVTIPFVFYAAGPIALIVSTALVLMFLYSIEPSHVYIRNGNSRDSQIEKEHV